MSKIWKALAIVTLGSVLVVSSFAQAAGPKGSGVQGGAAGGPLAGGGDGRGLRQMQKMEQEIWAKLTPPLSPEQKAKLTQIDQKSKDAYKALREKAQKGDKGALREEAQKIQQERRESVQALLTPEQKKTYMTLVKEAMEKIKADRQKEKGKGKGKGIG